MRDNGYFLKKQLNDKEIEYIAIETKVVEENLIIEEKRRILFVHFICSEILGTTEKLKMASNFEHFVAWTCKNGRNVFIVYKIFDCQDDEGYHTYEAVTIINHEQDLLFSENF